MSRKGLWVVTVIGAFITAALISVVFTVNLAEKLNISDLLGVLAVPSILIFILFVVSALGLEQRDDGEPLYDIEKGNHAIDFMKVEDQNVKVIISKQLSRKARFYQFPLESFNGEIIPDAKTLEVAVSGNRGQFKKLHLVKSDLGGKSDQEKTSLGIRITNF